MSPRLRGKQADGFNGFEAGARRSVSIGIFIARSSDAAETVESFDPASERPWAVIPAASAADVNRADGPFGLDR